MSKREIWMLSDETNTVECLSPSRTVVDVGDEFKPLTKQQRKDGILIASAPEMQRALQTLLERLHIDHRSKCLEFSTAMVEDMTAAYLALAKSRVTGIKL